MAGQLAYKAGKVVNIFIRIAVEESEAKSDENLFERQLVDKRERDEKIRQRTPNRARQKARTQFIPQRKRYSGKIAALEHVLFFQKKQQGASYKAGNFAAYKATLPSIWVRQ